MWIFSETKTRKSYQWYQEDSLLLQFLGYTQFEHDNASSTSVQTISVDHEEVSHPHHWLVSHFPFHETTCAH